MAFLISHPAYFLALGLGSGLAKKAPGTWGSVLGFPLFWLIHTLPPSQQYTWLASLFLLGIYLCATTGKALGIADHGSIVWDEIVAMALVLTMTPPNWVWYLIAFVLFRVFDIVKPFPIRQCDAYIKGGFGVMFDDLLAAIYAVLLLKLLLWLS